MKFEAYGKSLLVSENKSGSEIGGIKIATVGKLRSGKVISLGFQVSHDADGNLLSDYVGLGDEVVYVAEKAMPFEFGEPNVVIIHIDDVVALAPSNLTAEG
jgi:co-chaperonin GroES (HSP10)